MKILKPNEIKYESILDQDLYKFTMMWAVMQNFPDVKVKYEFVNRDNYKFPENTGNYLRKIINNITKVKLTKEEKESFQFRCGSYLPNLFFDFLEGYRFDPSEVGIVQKEDNLSINIEGYWYRTILWEVIIMSLLSELNFSLLNEKKCFEIDWDSERKKDNLKGGKFHLSGAKLVDFGTRRRFSYNNHKRVLGDLKTFGYDSGLIGSSNVKLAIDNDIKAIGTYAHEWVSGIASLLGYSHANKWAMELWIKTYNGNLGIALTDTFGTHSFLNDFDKKYAELFTGVRHDSGDPFIFGENVIKHYEKLNIDPKTKTIVFSDGLVTDTSIKLNNYFKNKIMCSFGIGTHLTNDLQGIKPINMVIKLFEIDNKKVIKLSDNEIKHTGDEKTINLVKELINYKKL